MKNLAQSALALLTIFAVAIDAPADEKEPKSISAESLNTILVIGKLGIPLGEVATVRATVLDGDSLQTKAEQGTYPLRITEVNGVKLKPGPILEFILAPGSQVKLANHNFELYELKTGKKARSLTREQTKWLKEDYVGTSHSLQVYELGEFSGIPKNLPQESMAWQDRGFHFRTYLRILRDLDAK